MKIKFLIALSLFAVSVIAEAAICTSQSNGRWDQAARWDCGHVPLSTDSVVIAHDVQMRNNYTVAGLTINAGATLDDNGDRLTLTGDVIINGTFGGNGGDLRMRTDGTTISGTGNIDDARLEIDANVTLSSGAVLNFVNGADIRIGNNSDAIFTINGAITAVGIDPGQTILRVDNNNNASVIINGSIDAPTSNIEIQRDGTILNNGTVSIAFLDGNNDANVTWTQGANSTLTLSEPTRGWNNGTFDASATGNTVNFNGTALPFDPATYFNIGGSNFTCPHTATITISGDDPCGGGTYGSVTGSPSVCVNDATIGTKLWSGLNNVTTKNAVYAQATGINGEISNYLKCTGYNFAIPDGATITGITAGVWAYSAKTMTDHSVVLVKAGVPQVGAVGVMDLATATRLANRNTQVTYGGAANLWGNTWTAADINNAAFGISFAVKRGNFNSTDTAFVDFMSITVSYSVPAEPHHFEVSYTGQAATCQPADMVVKACADAACNPYTSGATGTLTATGAVNFPNGADFTITSGQSQVTVPAWITQPITSTFDVTGGLNAATCNINGGCTLTASDSALLVTIPDHVAGTQQNVSIQAVRKADNAAVCTPAFTGSQLLGVACGYVLPATGTVSPVVDFAGIQCDGTVYSYTKNFDATGSTTMALSYGDVGRMNLTVSHSGSGASAGLAMSGTGIYVSAPASISITTPAAKQNAGAAFVSTVTALTSTGATAPNFGKEGETVQLALQLDAPASGNKPALSVGTVSFASGVAPITTSWSEVGQTRLQASLASGDYLATGLNPSMGEVAVKFIPDHFDTIVQDGCQWCGYTYSGQDFKTTIQAKNAGGYQVLNYEGAQACAVSLSLFDAAGATAIASGALTTSTIDAPNWASGQIVDWPTTFTFTASSTPVAPETIRIRAQESTCDAVASSINEGTTDERQGRIKVGNAYGRELLPLSLPVTLQYFDGTSWVAATSDSTTTLGGITYSNWLNMPVGSTSGTLAPASVIGGGSKLNLAKTGVHGSVDAGVSQPAFLDAGSARATFGIYSGNKAFIYQRESY